MRTYETLVILSPDLVGEELAAQVVTLQGFLESQNSEILKVDEWGTRKLAYLVKKQARGTFVLYIYNSDPSAIAEFERRLRIEESVLKFQTVLLEEGYTEPVVPVAVTADTGDDADEEDASDEDADTEASA
jgi:small subunit ribosomal protein S6